ncbi:differentially expressed in FDCP 8 homolog A-like [Babylonia areolata]|uniref:differentially expressed in FDCP 8 homolog A-like n=1 Tax=Babylonia areolata TaxID=304850 RepID=UPI003FD1A61D
MAHIVNTNIASVKISGSFSALNFSSSDEEGEDSTPTEGRRRSNAFINTHQPVERDITTRRRPNKRGQSASDPGHGASSESTTNHSCREVSSRSSYATTSSPPSVPVEGKIGSIVQRVSEDDCQTTSAAELEIGSGDTSHQNKEFGGSVTNTVTGETENKLPSHGKQTSPVSVTMRTCGAHGQNPADSAVSQDSGASRNSSREIYHQSRFNPFDRDIHLEEDHFSDNPENSFFGHDSSSPASALSSQSSAQDGDSDKVTFAELGLAEDHFSRPEGHFGFSKTEELEMAIDNCKDLIRKSNPNSDRQKNLVQKLVQLRLKLQELKEEPVAGEKDVVLALGHRLKRKESRSTKYYCEKCNGIIWGVVQEWRKCLDCGYKCHDKCVPQITRNCAMTKVKENPTFIMEICPRHPKGLLAQDYRCAECKAQILVADGVEPRLCEYNGRYYCDLCHWNDLMYLPAQILLNWEFEKYKVCRASKQFLKLMMRKAVINVQEVNPMLFNYVEQLSDIKNLREELLMMKRYILACPTAMQAKLLLQLSSRPHFVECSDRYSLQDLLDSDEKLIPELVQVHSSWAQHIKTDCELCQGRGYFCELCTSKEVLFPFDNIAVVCSGCSAVMHRICFAQQVTCPKCERRRKRQEERDPSRR